MPRRPPQKSHGAASVGPSDDNRVGGRAGGVAHVHQPLGTPTRRAVGTVASVSGRVTVGPYVRLTPRSPSRTVNIGHGGRRALQPSARRCSATTCLIAFVLAADARAQHPLAHIVVFHVKHLPRVPRWPPSHSPCTRHRRRGDRRPTAPLRPVRFSSQRQRIDSAYGHRSDRSALPCHSRATDARTPHSSNRTLSGAAPRSVSSSAIGTGQRTPHAQPMFHVKPRRADGLPARIDPGARPDPRAHRTRSELGETDITSPLATPGQRRPPRPAPSSPPEVGVMDTSCTTTNARPTQTPRQDVCALARRQPITHQMA
jgi:hypothetical protein